MPDTSGGGSGGGAGTGYNIPISVSYARTETINPTLNATTTFNFDSPWASGGTNDQTSRLTDSATATSSAAEGNAAAATQASNAQSGNSAQGQATGALQSIPSYAWLLAAGVAIFAIIWSHRK